MANEGGEWIMKGLDWDDPYRITSEMIERASEHFEDWYGNARFSEELRMRRKEVKRSIRHADVLMACVRVFSEY